ncbi:hypothetical protein F5B19DRAFT_437860 [Rostrohypoxylon terebratum]|nr:hypothetical protein F5B19DRAFT_437860 [Rostrohypoxylon terebratum]
MSSLVYRISHLDEVSPDEFIKTIQSHNESLSQLTIKLVSATRQPNGKMAVLLRIPKGDVPIPAEIKHPHIEFPRQLDKMMLGFTTIVAPKDHEVDIIAISGLNGNAYGSFKVHGGDHMWLLHSLPKRVPYARITLYGYLSDYLDNMSNLNIVTLGRSLQMEMHNHFDNNEGKPIVFIAHSLGGLVLQEAFRRSVQSPINGTSCWHESVHGLIFFGVPTSGMANAALIEVAKTSRPSLPLLYILGQSSAILEKDYNIFIDIASKRDIRVFCFGEDLNTQTPRRDSNQKAIMDGDSEWIVRPESANRIAEGFGQRHNSAQLMRNHTNLVKFSEDDNELEIVIREVQKICEDVTKRQTQSGAEVGRTAPPRAATAEEQPTSAEANIPNTGKVRTTRTSKSELKNVLLRQFPAIKDTDIPEGVYARMHRWLADCKDSNHSGNNSIYVYGKERADAPMLAAMSGHIISELIRSSYDWPVVFKLAHNSSAAPGRPGQALANLWGQLEIQCQVRLSPAEDDRDDITPSIEEFIRALKAYRVPQSTGAWGSLIVIFHVEDRYGRAKGESEILGLVSKVLEDLQKMDRIRILVVTETNCQPLKELFINSERVGAVLHAASRSLRTLKM